MRVDVYRKSDKKFITCYPVTGYAMAVFTIRRLYEQYLICEEDGFEIMRFLEARMVDDTLTLDTVRLKIVDKD